LRVRLFALGYLAEAEYRAGRWDESAATGEQAVSLAEDADHAWLLGFLHATAALPLAGRGEWQRAQTHVDAAQVSADAIGDVLNLAWTAAAATTLAQARGDPAGVIAASDVISAMDPTHGALEPGILRWCPERAEALVARHRFDDAAALLDAAEPVAHARRRRSSIVALARARGALEAARGHYAEATAAFDEAAALAPELGMPFDAALVWLAYGAHLRRGGRRRAAGQELGRALETFVALGAAPYVKRTETELAACGLKPRRRGPSPPTLTPRELAVARLVADGLTNREIAARLVISTKTVEYHLGNAFTKLGVRSRAQLVARLAPSGTDHN
jgi:DNA-binding CsgD family transcriptional regulator